MTLIADSLTAEQDQLVCFFITALITWSYVYKITVEYIRNCMFSFPFVCFPSYCLQAQLVLS